MSGLLYHMAGDSTSRVEGDLIIAAHVESGALSKVYGCWNIVYLPLVVSSSSRMD